MYNFNLSVLTDNIQSILDGIYMTIFISLVSSFLAFLLGVFFVYFRTSPSRCVSKFSDFSVSCIRNTPLLIVIYLFYKGLPSIGIVFPAIVCGILALGIYTATYISDALLSGINTIPDEHYQAAKALGLSRFQIFADIIYPQAVRNSVYILGSQFMNLIKNSSLVSFITVADIFYVTYKGIADSYRIYEYFILAIVVYCSLTIFTLFVTNILSNVFKISASEVRA